MIDTSMYDPGRGLRSGMQMGQQLGQAFGADPLQDALKRIQAGEDPQMIMAEMQKNNPEMASQLMKLIGGVA